MSSCRGTITRIDDYAGRHEALIAAGLTDATASPWRRHFVVAGTD